MPQCAVLSVLVFPLTVYFLPKVYSYNRVRGDIFLIARVALFRSGDMLQWLKFTKDCADR